MNSDGFFSLQKVQRIVIKTKKYNTITPRLFLQFSHENMFVWTLRWELAKFIAVCKFYSGLENALVVNCK